MIVGSFFIFMLLASLELSSVGFFQTASSSLWRCDFSREFQRNRGVL